MSYSDPSLTPFQLLIGKEGLIGISTREYDFSATARDSWVAKRMAGLLEAEYAVTMPSSQEREDAFPRMMVRGEGRAKDQIRRRSSIGSLGNWGKDADSICCGFEGRGMCHDGCGVFGFC